MKHQNQSSSLKTGQVEIGSVSQCDFPAFVTAKIEAIAKSGIKPRRGLAFTTVSHQRTQPRHSTPRAPLPRVPPIANPRHFMVLPTGGVKALRFSLPPFRSDMGWKGSMARSQLHSVQSEPSASCATNA